MDVSERYEAIRGFQQSFQLSPTKTSEQLGISYGTVTKAMNNLSPTIRTYETKLQTVHKNFIYLKTIADPHVTGDQIAQMIDETFGLKVSGRTINRFRNEIKLEFRAPINSVFLSPAAIDKRRRWTNFHIQNETCWRNVAFSDESWFQLGRNKRWVWVDKNNLSDKVFSHTKSHPPKVMIWAAIGWNFKSELFFVEGSVNTEFYFDNIILGSHFVEDADRCWGIGNWVFQQDNAPAHRSAETQAVLKELGITLLDDWPPYSPDLNIIEVIWAIMEARVEKVNPKSIDELKQTLIEVWENLDFKTINGLVSIMDDRIRIVNKNPERTIWKLTKI